MCERQEGENIKPKGKKKSVLDYGGGSVYYIKNRNCYAGQVSVEINGKKVRKTAYGETERAVRNKLIEIRIQAEAGTFDVAEDVTVYDIAYNLIEEQFALNEIKQATYERKSDTLKFLSPISNLTVQNITEDDIKRFFISKIFYSQSYLDKAYQLLKTVFKKAIRKKIIAESPMQDIKKPKSKKEFIKVRALTIEEQKKLIKVLERENILYSEQMLLSMFTGMRMGEINALEVKDVDFAKGTVSINKTVSRGIYGKTTISKTTKTNAGMRTIYLNQDIVDFLRQCIGTKKSGLIFLSSTDSIVTTNQVNYQYANTLKKFNIVNKNIRGRVDLHSLRHTYATRCIESGMSSKVLQHLLGHTDISITLNTYCDVFQKFSNESLLEADKYMKENSIKITGQAVKNNGTGEKNSKSEKV